MEAKFHAEQKAVDNYSATNNEWKGTHNNLQRELKEQQGTFVTRKELWLAVLAIVTVVISVLTLILKSKS